jgi:hypothetical protein
MVKAGGFWPGLTGKSCSTGLTGSAVGSPPHNRTMRLISSPVKSYLDRNGQRRSRGRFYGRAGISGLTGLSWRTTPVSSLYLTSLPPKQALSGQERTTSLPRPFLRTIGTPDGRPSWAAIGVGTRHRLRCQANRCSCRPAETVSSKHRARKMYRIEIRDQGRNPPRNPDPMGSAAVRKLAPVRGCSVRGAALAALRLRQWWRRTRETPQENAVA